MSETTEVVPVVAAPAHGRHCTWVNAAIAAAIALAAFAIYFLPAVLRRPLQDGREIQTAAVARTMLTSGDYVQPAFDGEPLIQPPMPFWLSSFSSALFFKGASGSALDMARATQLPPAMSAAFTVFLVIFFGAIFFGRAAGVMGGLMLATTFLPAQLARTGYPDAILMLACCTSVCGMAALLSERPGLFAALLTGFGLGLGILTKGALPLLLMAFPVAAELFFRRKTIGWINILYIALAFSIALVVASPWFILVSRANPGAIDSMVMDARDSVYKSAPERQLADPGTQQMVSYVARLGHFFYRAAVGMLPWTPLLIAGFIVTLLPLKSEHPVPENQCDAARFFALYAGIGALFFLFAQSKHETDLLPLFPALALAAGAMFGRFSAPGGIREERMGWIHLVLGVASIAAFCGVAYLPAALSLLQQLGIAEATDLAQWAARSSLFAIIGSVLILIISFICARLWTTGNALAVIAIHAVLMFAFTLFLSVRPSAQARRDAIWEHAGEVPPASQVPVQTN